jgi:phospholipid transport system substrate-binding protein
VSAVDTDNPADVITSVARSLLTDIATHRDQYRADSAKLDNLVRAVVLPHFDSTLAARLVLAHHWDDASVEQRRRFIDAFYHFLLNNFGADLVDFSLGRLQVLPYRGDPDATYAEVRTLVRRRNGDLVHVDYSLHRSKQGWKVYDIAFQGISYLTSFRGDFAEEIEQKGLDELISRLQSEYAGAATKAG